MKHILSIAFLFIPLIAFIQSRNHFFKKLRLKGDVITAGEALFSFSGWFSGDYQTETEKYLNDNFGFRNVCVRINNQLEYSLFKKVNAKDVIIGKDNYLFEGSYIRAYFGSDFIGADKIIDRTMKMKYIQDTLVKLHKTLIIVFAPSKASFYPEYIPDSCIKQKGKTNYEAYAQYANGLHVNHIDFNKYFIENKNKSKYPLYPQYGVHWSFYGTCLATDSLIRYIEYKRGIRMPHIFWNQVDVKNAYAFSDYDIADGMNLLFKFGKQKLAYPRVQFESGTGKTKPSVLVVADSHYWGMFNLGISQAFLHNDFWYYNREVYSEKEHGLSSPGQLTLKNEIKDHDVFIIMATQSTLNDMGWGFVDNLYNFFKGTAGTIPHFNEKVATKKLYIRTNAKWMTDIGLKAQKKQISIDSMITLDAIWVVEDDYKKQLQWQRQAIKSNPKWMEQIKIKANARKLSVDSMVNLDAKWVTDNAEKH